MIFVILGSSEVLGPIHRESLPVRCEAHRHDLQGGDARHALQPQEDRHARIQVSYFRLLLFHASLSVSTWSAICGRTTPRKPRFRT